MGYDASNSGFFDADKRLAVISRRVIRLVIDRVVPFESFTRPRLKRLTLSRRVKEGNAGRKPIESLLCFGCWCAIAFQIVRRTG